MDRLPEREASRMAALPYTSRMRNISPASLASAGAADGVLLAIDEVEHAARVPAHRMARVEPVP